MADADQSSSVAPHPQHVSEEWPDNDVDVNSPEGAQAAQRAQDALYNEFARQTRERQQQFRGPDKAYEIPKELYQKAEKTNDQLTEEERALLLSRGDVVGKALAHPDSLTLKERYEVLQWSPPNELHAAIRKATDGELSTPEELYAMAHNGNSDKFMHLSPEVKRILASKFWIDATTETHWPRFYWSDVPGNGQAAALLYKRAGMDISFFSFAYLSAYLASDPAPNQGPGNISEVPASSLSGIQPSMQAVLSMLPHPSSLFSGVDRPSLDEFMARQEQEPEDGARLQRKGRPPRGPPTREMRGWDGKLAWPIHVNAGRFKALGLFWDDQKMKHPGESLGDVWKSDDVPKEVLRRFEALGEQDRAAYEARSEKLRQEVWDEWEEYERRRARGEMVRPPQRQHP